MKIGRKVFSVVLCMVLLIQSFGLAVFAQSSASNPKQTDAALESKVNETLSQFTLRNRSYLANGAVDIGQSGQLSSNGNQTKAFPDLGLSYMAMSDGPMGVNQGARAHTSFGSGLIIASTWNRALTEKVGEVVGKESLAKNVQYFLGPATNINRDLVNGRTFEYYSEDQFLSSNVITPYVKGIQSQNVAATIKHLMANNQEWNRNFSSSNMSERAMHELYLTPFKDSVVNGDAWAFMTAANRMNGVFTSDNRYTMTNMLKNDFGFRGIIMTDWCNVRTGVISAKAGLDIAMPASNGSLFAQAKMEEYVRSGKLDIGVLNNLAQRVIRTAYLTKSMITTDTVDNTGYTAADRPAGEINTAANQAVSKQVSEEGIVLLKNEGSLLPLNKDSVTSIAVLGKFTNYQFYGNHGGSGVTFPPYQITNIQGLNNKLAGSDVALNRPAYDESTDTARAQTLANAVAAARNSEVAVIYAGLASTSTSDPNVADTEDGDRQNLDFPAFQLELINAVAAVNPNTIVVLSGSIFEVRDWVDHVPAVLQTFYPGMEGGNAIADILFGNVNPSGKLTNTWPKRYEDTQGYVAAENPGDQKALKRDDVWYKEGVFVGYKWNDLKSIEPEFPFGYGLSYTTFAYSNPRLSADAMAPDGTITASVDVTNTGSVAGKEVVQMYINDPVSSVARPLKELKGYEKISLNPGETKTVSFRISVDSLSYWDVNIHSFMAEAGEYQVWIGSSSADLPMKVSFQLTASTQPDEDYQVIQAEAAAETSNFENGSAAELDSELMQTPDTQYIRFTQSGGKATWNVTVAEEGKYSVIVRYANPGYNGPAANSYGPNKVSALSVNGEEAGSYDFQNTRWANVWNYDSIDVVLQKGSNEIAITAGANAADLRIDKLIVQTLYDAYPEAAKCAPDSGDIDPPDTTEDGDVYQAENVKTLSDSVVEARYPGYTGSGYVSLSGAGSQASWDIISNTFARGFRIALTYANGNSTASECDLYINGIHAGTYFLAPTGSWKTWKTEQSPILTLNTGINVIRVVSKTQGVAIDKLVVSGGMVDMETKAPVVNGSIPGNKKTLTNLAGSLVVGYSEVIQPVESLSGITISDGDGGVVQTTATISGTKLIIQPAQSLEYDKNYTVNIPGGLVQDEKFNIQQEAYSFGFTTPVVDRFENDDERISYSGTWKLVTGDDFSGGSACASVQANATASLWFSGENALIYGTKGPDQGIVQIRLDDDKSVVTVDLYSPVVQQNQVIYTTGGITSGVHFIKVELTGNQNASSTGTGAAIDAIGTVGSLIDPPLGKTGWSATSFATGAGGAGQPEGPSAALDGKHGSRWVSTAMQSPSGQWFMLDLGEEKQFNTLVSDTPNLDYIRGYRVYVSNDPAALDSPESSAWGQSVASGAGNQYYTTMSLGDQSARYIMIRQSGTASGNWWCVHEYYLFNRALEDRQAPTAPEFLTAQSYNSQIILSWDPSSDDIGVAGYNVYRDGVKIGSSVAPGFTDGTARNLLKYTYTVEAFDAAGNSSEASEPLQAMTNPSITKLPRDNWVASAYSMPASASGLNDTPAAAIDSNPNSRWTSGQMQNGNGSEWFQIDFGDKVAFNKLDVYLGGAGDYMRGYRVVVSDDGVNWSDSVAEGAGTPSPGSTVINISEMQVARFVRIIQTGAAPGNWWSISDLNVYADAPAFYACVPGNIIRNERFVVTIKTEASVEKLVLRNENEMKIGSTILERSVEDGVATWRIALSVGTVGKGRTLTAYDLTDKTPSRVGDFTFDVLPIPDGILAVSAPGSVTAQKSFEVTVVTTDKLIKAKFYNEKGNVIGSTRSSRVFKDGLMTCTYSIQIDTPGESRVITVKADYDKQNNFPFEKHFTLAVSPNV